MSESLELGDSQEEVPRVDHHIPSSHQRLNTVFSNEGIEELLDYFGSYAAVHCTGSSISSKKPKMTMRYILENEEELTLRVKIFKVKRKGEPLYAIELSKVRGSHWAFMSQVDALLESMGDLVVASQ